MAKKNKEAQQAKDNKGKVSDDSSSSGRNVREYLVVVGLLLCVVVFLCFALGDDNTSDGIVALDDASFDQWIEEHPFTLVEFYVSSNSACWLDIILITRRHHGASKVKTLRLYLKS